MIFLEELRNYQDIIESVELVEYLEEERISQLKGKIRLIDASYLWIREIKKKNQLIAYSYYWLDSNNKVIAGWDNAPHHKEIETFPHHKHVGDRVEPSRETTLKDVLAYLHSLLKKGE